LRAALLNPLTGGSGLAIAAGLGLILAGTFVKSLAGRLGGSAAPGSSLTAPGTGATPTSGGGPANGSTSDNLKDKSAAVQVVVQGNIFDSDATGLRIANILKEVGFTNSVVT
jgi:hypothetical protein